jgi:hypothetical protein
MDRPALKQSLIGWTCETELDYILLKKFMPNMDDSHRDEATKVNYVKRSKNKVDAAELVETDETLFSGETLRKGVIKQLLDR